MALQLEDLIEASDVKVLSWIAFEEPPSLKVLESLLITIYEELEEYSIYLVSSASA